MTAPARLWNKNFSLFWLGTLLAEFGTAIGGLALSFLVLTQTGSAGLMGVTLALTLLPGVLAPLAGTYIDRWPLKPPLVLGNALRGLGILAVALLAFSGGFSLWLVYAVSLLNGVVDMFATPAAHGAVPTLVPPDEYSRASGVMGIATQSGQFVGLVGGGALVGPLGQAPALAVNAALLLTTAALVLLVRLPRRPAPAGRPQVWADLRAGLNLVRSSRPLTLLMLVIFVGWAAFAPLEVLVPLRMLDLGLGARGYGLFFGVLVGGMLAGSGLIALLGRAVAARHFVGAGLGLFAVGMLGLALSAALLPTLAWAALLGLGLSGVTVGATAFETQRVPEGFRGRISGLQAALSSVAAPATLFALSGVADRLPPAWLFSAFGALAAVLAVVWTLGLRAVKHTKPDPSSTNSA